MSATLDKRKSASIFFSGRALFNLACELVLKATR